MELCGEKGHCSGTQENILEYKTIAAVQPDEYDIMSVIFFESDSICRVSQSWHAVAVQPCQFHWRYSESDVSVPELESNSD